MTAIYEKELVIIPIHAAYVHVCLPASGTIPPRRYDRRE